LEHSAKYDFIIDNLKMVRDEIAKAAIDAGRDPEEITLVGVSKRHPAEAAEKAFLAGLRDLGENITDELLEKSEILSSKGLQPTWHMIGNLQRRKVKTIIEKTGLIHSVDSIRLLDEISKRSASGACVTDVLLEMNVSGEDTKHGFTPENKNILEKAITEGRPGVRIRGLMTMAPFTSDEKLLNTVFEKAYGLFNELKAKSAKDALEILSMGMSNDYTLAEKHGATHLRIGTAIFGEREY
jgi:hypothetical protein